MKKCGALWNALTEEEKKKYDEMHNKDEIRYRKQMDDLDKLGYFVTEDGSKSSEHRANLKKRANKELKSQGTKTSKKD